MTDHRSLATAPTAPVAFTEFADGLKEPTELRAEITSGYRRPEPEALPPLLDAARQPSRDSAASRALAHRITTQLRNRKNASGREGLVQGRLQEYTLSSQEGVALMCLAKTRFRRAGGAVAVDPADACGAHLYFKKA
jgi:RHH-type proline utilization regulon transcriptional repressor/proline dehydrogenase/delta 1-pyrroline-5-carboxylate dehydrogenase